MTDRSSQLCISSVQGARLANQTSIAFITGPAQGASAFRIDESLRHQRIDGFGASFTEAGTICLNSLSANRRKEVVEALFDPIRGAGFSAMVTFIGATDFSSAGPRYSYADIKAGGDDPLANFSIARDLTPDGVVPFIQAARECGSFVLQARLDYPPDWMLLSTTYPHGQIIDPNCYETLARYFAMYVRAYEALGITVDYLSPFNEPGNFTKISVLEIAHLLKTHIAPLFAKEGLRTRFQLGDAPYRDWACRLYPQVLDDPAVRKLLSGITYHNYDWALPATRDDAASLAGIAQLHERYPELALWMTESCYGSAFQRDKEWMKPLPRHDFEDGDFWGRQIASELLVGASGWIYFNAILDQTGGPWLTSELHFYLAENRQQPVVIVNRETGDVTFTGLYYYLAHFSRFVPAGSVRIGASGEATDVVVLAFVTPDQRIVVQAINSRNSTASIQIESQGQHLNLTLPATSISTLHWSAA